MPKPELSEARRIGRLILFATILALTLIASFVPQLAQAQVPDNKRDTRSWTDPGGSGLTITFSTPETYHSCTSAFDRIYTEGIPDTWQLSGTVRVMYITPTGPEPVPNGEYPINQVGNLDLTITYPPVWQWPDVNPTTRELHVDVSIQVRNKGFTVDWVGGDLAGAPGTLGPGGQDWNVFCNPPRYTLGDRVWYDQDQDGIQDGNEPGYSGAP